MMNDAELAAIATRGSIYAMILEYAFTRFADDCEAFFGYSGDARAIQVALSCGFTPTPNPRIFVNWHRPLPDARRHELQAMVEALGPF